MLPTARSTLLLALVVLTLAAGTSGAERLPITHLAAGDGLGHDNARCSLRDSRGLLWFCTSAGVARFDGTRVRAFDARAGLPSAAVNDLIETRDGALWAASARGLFVLRPDQPDMFRRVDLEPSRAASTARDLAVHRLLEAQGRVFAGTDDGLFALDLGAPEQRLAPVESWPQLTDPSIRSLLVDNEEVLWVGGRFGLFLWSQSSARRVPLPASAGTVTALFVDREGTLWVGTDDGVFVVRRAGTADSSSTPAPEPVAALSSERVRSLFQTADGNLWVGAVGGLLRFDGRRWRRYTLAQGLPDETVNAMLQDEVGNLWLATDAAGVVRLVHDGLVAYDLADGLGHISVSALVPGRSGPFRGVTHVVGEVGAFLSRFEGGERGTFVAARPHMPGAIAERLRRTKTRALQDHTGAWWIASVEGLIRYPPTDDILQLANVAPSAIYRATDGLTADVVYLLLEDAAGDLWIGTAASAHGALTRWHRRTERFERYAADAGLPESGEPTALYLAPSDGVPSGVLWVGWSSGELLRFDGETFTSFALPTTAAINDLLLDSSHRLWVATGGDGVAVSDPDHPTPWRILGQAAGLASLDTRCLVEDLEGRIYVGTVTGIDRLDLADGAVHPFSVRHFGTADGLPQLEITAALRDPEGALWFGTYGGVARLVPGADPTSPTPATFVDGVSVDDRPFPTGARGARRIDSIELPPGRHRVRIDFFAPDYQPGRQARYQYRLDRRSWSTPSTERSVVFAELGAGSHRFEVRVFDDQASGAAASVSVAIEPPFWQRAWFVLLIALCALALLLLAHRARLSSALALERVRTRIAADLHDDLGAGLSRISFLSEVARRRDSDTGSDELLSQIGRTARALTGKAREIVWSLDPRYDDLASLVVRLREAAAELLDPAQIAWSFEAPEEEIARRVRLRPELRQHLLLMFKESLHNAARHAAAERVEMALTLDGGMLVGQIHDNGRGIADLEAAHELGHGLSNLRDRAAALGGTLQISGPGTRIEFRVPLLSSSNRRGRLA